MTVPHVQLINPENQIVEVSSSGLAITTLVPDVYWSLIVASCGQSFADASLLFIDCKFNVVCVCVF